MSHGCSAGRWRTSDLDQHIISGSQLAATSECGRSLAVSLRSIALFQAALLLRMWRETMTQKNPDRSPEPAPEEGPFPSRKSKGRKAFAVRVTCTMTFRTGIVRTRTSVSRYRTESARQNAIKAVNNKNTESYWGRAMQWKAEPINDR